MFKHHLRALNLTEHAARTKLTARAAGRSNNFFGNIGHMAAQLGIGVNGRIFIKQTVNIGQHNQQIGFNDFRHDCRQTVVIAELGGMVHLVHADRIVFIDNRNDADGKQGFKSIGNVCQTFRIFDHITC